MEACILVFPGYLKMKMWGVEGRIQTIYCRLKCHKGEFGDAAVPRPPWVSNGSPGGAAL